MARARAVAALSLVYVIFAVLMNSVGAVILQSIRTLHVAKADAALLETFKELPIAAVSIAAAGWLPRLGFRRGMILGLAAVAVACAAMPLAKAFWMARILFVTVGISFALAKMSVYAAIGLSTSTPRGHASLTSLLEGVFMIGVLAGNWLFSAFIDPNNAGSLAWLDVYWVLAAGAVLAALLLAVTPLNERAESDDAEVRPSLMASIAAIMREPSLTPFLVCAFLCVLVEQSLWTWLPTFNNEVLKLEPALSVRVTSLFAAAIVIGRLGCGWVLSRAPWAPVLLACLLGLALMLSLSSIAGPGQIYLPLAMLALAGVFLGPVYPTLNSAALSALPHSRHGAMTALIVVASSLGGAIGSFLTGRAFAWLGDAVAFRLTLAPIVLLAVTIVRFRGALSVQQRSAGR